MELQYDYKSVDWKALKAAWDASPTWFRFQIQHGENEITFQAYVNKSKKIKLWVYVNGVWNYDYMTNEHAFQKYHRACEMLTSKRIIDMEKRFDRKLKKLTTRQVMEKKGIAPFRHYTPCFDNISQIKKMVTSLE